MDLDDDFAQMANIPGGQDYPPRWAAKSEAFRAAMADRLDSGVSYGASVRQVYDFFRPEGQARGTMVFVHGGYWLRNDRLSSSHLAAGALARGWNVAVVQYDLCPEVRIADITNQVARAIEHVAARAPGPVSLTGHSAGGHLVARMLAPGILDAGTLARIVAVAPIAPVADLRPLLRTSMNDAFGMDIGDAAAESPVLQPAPDTPVTIWVGTDERPALLEQAHALAGAWKVPLVVVPGLHHFDIIDALEDADSDIVAFLASQ